MARSAPDATALPAGILALILAACLWMGPGCGDSETPETADAVPPISGAALDAVQANLREILDRDFGGLAAERVRVERSEDGRRAVVHASLATPLDEEGYTALCGALGAAASSVLASGQSLELHVLRGDQVVHSCGL